MIPAPLLLVFALQATAAAPAIDPANAAMRDGYTRLDKNQPIEAQARFDECVARARELKLPSIEGQCERGLGRATQNQHQYEVARRHFEQAHALFAAENDHAGLGANFNDRGYLAVLEGKAFEVRDFYTKASEEFGLAGIASEQAAALRSETFAPGMPLVEKLGLLSRALDIATEAKATRVQGMVLHLWGDYLFGISEYAESIEKTQRAVALLEQTTDRYSLARALTSLGRLYRAHGKPELALDQYSRVLGLQETIADIAGQAQTHNAMSIAVKQLGRPRDALPHLELALELARRAGTPAQIAFQTGQLAGGFVDIGEFARAVPLYQQAIESKGDAYDAPIFHSGLADALIGLQLFAEGDREATTAIDLATAAGQIEWRVDILLGRAKGRERSGRRADALADLKSAAADVEQQRQKLAPTDLLKSGFAEQSQAIYSRTISLLDLMGRTSEAVTTAEQARARAFLDLLATREERGVKAAGVSDASAPTPTAATLQNVATRLRSTLLTYWVGDDATDVWVVSRDGKVTSHRVPIARAKLQSLVRRTASLSGSSLTVRGGAVDFLTMRGGERLPRDEESGDPYRELYDLLIKPVRAALPARDGLVTVIPHGPLFELSFAGLSDANQHYLIEDYRLNYAPSVATLEFTGRHQSSSAPAGAYLLVANPAVSPKMTTPPLPPLPGAEREVRAVSDLIGGRDSKTLTGAAATEDAISDAVGKYRVIHFATHGLVSSDHPLESFLAVAPDAGARPSDGRLTAAEIYGLRFSADLVVLSSCRSAAGQISGDGIVGLTRAFFSAGTPSIVASLWDMADESAEHLIPRFYAEWRKTGDKGRALRAAQLAMLQDLRAGRIKVQTPLGAMALPAHPALWANLVLIGEPR